VIADIDQGLCFEAVSQQRKPGTSASFAETPRNGQLQRLE
jgi:hypothetical protein